MTNTQKDALSMVSELNLTLLELIKDSDRLVLENQRLKLELDRLRKKVSVFYDIESNQKDGSCHKKTTNDECDQNYSSDDFGYESMFEDAVTMQRPTDEELTNLFMNTPVNSDVDNLDIEGFKKAANDILNDKEKMSKLLNNTGLYNSDGKLKKEFDINHKDNQELDKKYLNPQKHIGGDNTKKDIVFSGDDMVKAVNEYADSLKVKNLSEENEKLKVFLNRFLTPDDLGFTVSPYVRDEIRIELGLKPVESERNKT